ncbi:MAG: spore cortex biosynthesis protein YabQ [Solirubrobacterales bacterium]
MLNGLVKQLAEFLLTGAVGMAVALLFQLHQRWLRWMAASGIVLVLYDFLFWTLALIIVFVSLLWINQGEVRLYVLVALGFGAGLYAWLFRPGINRLINAVSGLLARLPIPRNPKDSGGESGQVPPDEGK